MIDVAGTWAENWDLFVEIGAGSSVCTRLIRQITPKRVEEAPLFRAFLHYMPVIAAALFLGGIHLWNDGGRVVLHAVTIGGMSGNLRDIFAASIDRLKPPRSTASSSTQITITEKSRQTGSGGEAPPPVEIEAEPVELLEEEPAGEPAEPKKGEA